MNLQTQVVIPKARFDISHHSHMLLMGSCFSENIGNKLKDNKFSVSVNPFGIMYNPISIYNAMCRLLDKKLFAAVIADHADDNGAKTQYFAGDGANGKIGNVVNQPGRRADQTVFADGFGILKFHSSNHNVISIIKT